MEPLGPKDTIAYKITDQIVSHIYPQEKFTEKDFNTLCRGFMNSGGSWQFVIEGDVGSITHLMDCLKAFFKIRNKPKKYGLK